MVEATTHAMGEAVVVAVRDIISTIGQIAVGEVGVTRSRYNRSSGRALGRLDSTPARQPVARQMPPLTTQCRQSTRALCSTVCCGSSQPPLGILPQQFRLIPKWESGR